MKRIVVIGNGNFGQEAQIYVRDAFPEGSGYVLDRAQDLYPQDPFEPSADEVFVVAHGDPTVKASLVQRIEAAGGTMLTVIHPTCYVAPNAVIGRGALLCPFVFVGPKANLAPHVTMNVHSGCGHNAELGMYAVISPHVSISGWAEIGERVLMGTHAYVEPRKKVGARSRVSAGGLILEDVPEDSLVLAATSRTIAGYYG